MKRVFLIVLDSFGVGELADVADFGDSGSNTLLACSKSPEFNVPNMKKLGLFNIDGCSVCGTPCENPIGNFGKLAEKSQGKDTTTGHWEMAGLVSEKKMPTYPNGFPDYILKEFEQKTGCGVLCNKPYSGTDVIRDYGKEHLKTGKLIVYTSADSVFQIAAHEGLVPVKELYGYCEIARKILCGKDAVGRVIARPFVGQYPNFTRTSNRHDFSLVPPKDTMLNLLSKSGKDVLAVGKINDIFAGSGVTDFIRTKGNDDGMEKTDEFFKRDFNGLCFVNLVDFDMLYGHRNDVDGYAAALTKFDLWFGKFIEKLGDDDCVMLTSDHGCDPSTASTDHSREYIFSLSYGKQLKEGVNIGIRSSFSDISATVLDLLGVNHDSLSGDSFADEILK